MQPTAAAEPPIFVVGTGRSGTTLLASILDANSRVSCGPETGFFVGLTPALRRSMVSNPEWPDAAVRYLLSLARMSGNVAEHFGLDETAIRAALSDRAPSIQAVLEALTATLAQRRGRPRWAEKTPTHLRHVREIRSLWPEAPIIRIVRDPRAVAASHLHVPWGPRTVVGAAYDWQFQEDSARRFLASDGRSMTLRYEELVAETEAQVRRVCAFAGLPFELGMLDPDVGASSGTQAWKTSLVIDAGRANAWQAELSTVDQSRVAIICADGMQRHGYQGAGSPVTTVFVHPYDLSLSDAQSLLEETADSGVALRPLLDGGSQTQRDPILFYGSSGRLRWTRGHVTGGRLDGGHLGGGLRAVSWWARLIVVARIRGRTLVLIDDKRVRRPVDSWTERACDRLLRLAIRPTTATAALKRVVGRASPRA